MDSADGALIEEAELLCPSCGYDLRASSPGRCSECGEEIDISALSASHFPWVQRKSISTYAKTIWLLTIASRTLRYEHARPQALKDARRFAWMTAGILIAFLLSHFAVMVSVRKDLSFMAVHPPPMYSNVKATWSDDLLVPWSAGATIWPVMPMMLIFLGITLSRAHQRLFRMPNVSVSRQERATAIGDYAGGTVALWAIAGVLLILLYLPTEVSTPIVQATIAVIFAFITARLCVRVRSWKLLIWIPLLWVLCLGLAVLSEILIGWAEMYGRHPMRISIAGLLLLAAIFIPALRIEQWSLRVKHAGLERALLDVPHLFALWLLAIIGWLAVVPWCIGLIWIAIDSFL
jgi:hypothetical protein